MIFSNAQQGSEEWLEARRGVITASRFKDALDRLADKPAKEARYHKKTLELLEEARPAVPGGPSSACLLYAKDLARERCDGSVFGPYVNAQMRWGTEQEPLARMEYEVRHDLLVREVGFFCTDDRKFGLSVDGIVQNSQGSDVGAIEIKSIASSEQLFKVLVEKDYSDYIHQITAPMWLLALEWTDLILWTPDLPKRMHVVRFSRDDDFIESMEDRLVHFDGLVNEYTKQLQPLVL
jgi:exodeoxyribonuclease (lambda-induced)